MIRAEDFLGTMQSCARRIHLEHALLCGTHVADRVCNHIPPLATTLAEGTVPASSRHLLCASELRQIFGSVLQVGVLWAVYWLIVKVTAWFVVLVTALALRLGTWSSLNIGIAAAVVAVTIFAPC